MEQLHEFDEIDRKIIAILKKNGRTSSQKIATQLDLTATTVSARLKRMDETNAMRVVAVSDFSAYGFELMIPVGIDVKGRRAEDVATELAELDEVFSCHLMTGKHDIEVLLVLQDQRSLQTVLLDKLAKIEGIRNLDPAVSLDVLKYEFDMAPIS